MRIKNLFYIIFFIFTLLIIGCAPQKMYYWGNYSNTLYNYRKNPNDKTLLKHKQELEKIVEKSTKRSLKIPPGVYAELGYIYFRQNNTKEAIKFFQLEKKLYPESYVFMDRLVKATELQEKDDLSLKSDMEN